MADCWERYKCYNLLFEISHFVIFVQILPKPTQIEWSQFVCKDYSLISHCVCQSYHPAIFASLYLFSVYRDWTENKTQVF